MKTLDEVRQLKKQFSEEYSYTFRVVGNNLAIGLGKDPITGEFTIIANLTTDAWKYILPTDYHGVKVEIEVVGEIVAH